MRTLAGLFRAVEAETPYGGRSVTFEAVGVGLAEMRGRGGGANGARGIRGGRLRPWRPRRGRMGG